MRVSQIGTMAFVEAWNEHRISGVLPVYQSAVQVMASCFLKSFSYDT